MRKSSETVCRISKYGCFSIRRKCSWHEGTKINDIYILNLLKKNHQKISFSYEFPRQFFSLFIFIHPRCLNWQYLNRDECTLLYTVICKINYFILLKPLYIRRRNKKLFLVYRACMPQTLFYQGSYCYICENVLNRLPWKEKLAVYICYFCSFDKLFVTAFCVSP